MNAAAIRFLVEKGLSASEIADFAEMLEKRADPTAADRMRRYRERKTRNVTRNAAPPIEELHNPPELLDEASASSQIRQPISEARDFWNETAVSVGWSQVRELSPARSKLLGARLRQHGLDGWKAAVTRARASPYLGGADPPSWFTFPWLIKSENFLKTIEGNYDRNRTNGMGRNQSGNGISATVSAAIDVFGLPEARDEGRVPQRADQVPRLGGPGGYG